MPEVTQGVVTEGWPYAIAAYTITAGVLTGYALSLVYRFKKAAQQEEVES